MNQIQVQVVHIQIGHRGTTGGFYVVGMVVRTPQFAHDEQIFSGDFLVNVFFENLANLFFIQIDFGAINVTISVIQRISDEV